MVKIRIYDSIANKQEGVFLQMFGMDMTVFSAETVSKLLEENKNEADFLFNIHCNGGSVEEGLAIYDILRTSGKNIHMHIEGGCHSMATILLLAAPLENRTANINSHALIHRVRTEIYGNVTAEDLERAKETIEECENSILNIYAERTGNSIEDMQELMNAEKELTAQELKQYGFISKIVNYNTNLKTNKMSTKNENSLLQRAKNFVDGAMKAITGAKNLLEGDPKNFDFTDADGNVLFSTEKEDDSLAVGDAATPDGTFELPDGRTVTIADGAVTEIVEPATDNELENVKAENEQLRNQVTELTNKLEEAVKLIDEFKNKNGSSYVPKNRVAALPAKNAAVKTSEDFKAELRERREKLAGGKK